MEKKFTYCYGNDYEYEEYEYVASNEELLEAVSYLIYEDYFKDSDLSDRCDFSCAVRRGLYKFIYEMDILEELVEAYEKELKDWFEEDIR